MTLAAAVPKPFSAPSFLPEGFDPTAGIALIAGKGDYPGLSLAHMSGLRMYLVALEGETAPELWAQFPPERRVQIAVGQVGALLKHLKRFSVRYALMVGQVTPGHLFRGFRPDWKALRLLWGLQERNAESLFGAVALAIEALGVQVLDARSFLEDHLVTPGVVCGRPLPLAPEYLQKMVDLARLLAQSHVGQGLVVAEGTILAVEAFEGTNAMLRRAGAFGAKNPVFFKTSKPGQDYRFDVPVVGLHTLSVLEEAGIRHLALESQRCLLLDKPRLLILARERGFHIWGF